MTGRLFMPLSNQAWVAILILVVSRLHHRMLCVACETQPGKTPCLEFALSVAAWSPGGCTHKEQMLKKSSLPPVAKNVGKHVLEGLGNALDIQSAWWQNVQGQNFMLRLALRSEAQIASASVQCRCLTGPFCCEMSALVGRMVGTFLANRFSMCDDILGFSATVVTHESHIVSEGAVFCEPLMDGLVRKVVIGLAS